MTNPPSSFFFQGLKQLSRGLRALFFVASLTFMVGTKTTYAEGQGVFEAISNGIAKLISGITNINIESTTLGIDKGVIAGAVLGIGRTVERNPFPTGEHDQYLVKDRLRLGYELGAGFVVAGTISYVQEWTLVYPVESSLKGTLSRKFLVDLFLPMRVKKWNSDGLPREYALIRESFIEGKGRLKAGGMVPLMVGNQVSYGKVQLESIMTRHHKDGTIKLIRELSSYYRLAYELWANLVIFDLPIFEAYRHRGEVVRNYLDIPAGYLPKPARGKLFKALFTGKDLTKLKDVLKDEKIKRQVHSKFEERYSSITFFGLFNKDSFTREDYVTDTIFLDNGETDISHWWQNIDRHYHDWTSGLESELYRSDVQFSGRPIFEDNPIPSKPKKVVRIEEPQMRIKLNVKDENTSLGEYHDDFLATLEYINGERPHNWPLLESWTELSSKMTGRTTEWPETNFTLEIHLEEDHLKALQNSEANDWYQILEKETGKPRRFWENAADGGFHSRNRQRLRQTKPSLGEVYLAKKIKTINRFIKKSREYKNSDPLLSHRFLNWAVRKMFSVGSSHKNTSWDLRLLRALTKLTPHKPWTGANLKVYFKGEESKVDSIVQLQTSVGESLWQARPEYNFILKDPSEIYHLFEEVSFL